MAMVIAPVVMMASSVQGRVSSNMPRMERWAKTATVPTPAASPENRPVRITGSSQMSG